MSREKIYNKVVSILLLAASLFCFTIPNYAEAKKNTTGLVGESILEKNQKQYFKNSEIHMLVSVTGSQCLSIIIKDAHDNVIIFDGGWAADKDHLVEKVKSLGTNHVAAWFITHEHPDHVGCLDALLKDKNKQLVVDNIYRGKKIPLTVLLGTTAIAQINNSYVCKEDAINNSSICYKVLLEDKTILITGDIGHEGANNILKDVDSDILHSYFLQMPHHGAHHTLKEFYKTVNPTVCLWPTFYGSDLLKPDVLRTKEVIKELGVKENFFLNDKDIVIK